MLKSAIEHQSPLSDIKNRQKSCANTYKFTGKREIWENQTKNRSNPNKKNN
jgi:hypothetical protein